MADKSSEVVPTKTTGCCAELIDNLSVAVFRIATNGKLVYYNKTFAAIFGFNSARDLTGHSLTGLFQNNRSGYDFTRLTLELEQVSGHLFLFEKKDKISILCTLTTSRVLNDKGKVVYLDGTIMDITKEMESLGTANIEIERERLAREKLQGVLEMAGGAAHRVNQPLTILNNLLNEILSGLHHDDHNYEQIMKVHNQVENLNELARKIRGIKKYEAMDYVGGIQIVDIDKSS